MLPLYIYILGFDILLTAFGLLLIEYEADIYVFKFLEYILNPSLGSIFIVCLFFRVWFSDMKA